MQAEKNLSRLFLSIPRGPSVWLRLTPAGAGLGFAACPGAECHPRPGRKGLSARPSRWQGSGPAAGFVCALIFVSLGLPRTAACWGAGRFPAEPSSPLLVSASFKRTTSSRDLSQKNSLGNSGWRCVWQPSVSSQPLIFLCALSYGTLHEQGQQFSCKDEPVSISVEGG